MRLNEDKCHFITLGTNHTDTIQNGSSTEHESNQEKLLSIIIDNKLTWKEHHSKLCKKVSNKLYALSRISHLLDQNKLRVLMRAPINSHLHYCILTLIFYSRKLDNKIDKLYEHALRIIYRDHNSFFESLLEKDASTAIHFKNLKIKSEMFENENVKKPEFMLEVFPCLTVTIISYSNSQRIRT